MLRWTLKSLIREPWHLLASVSAVSGAFVLVVFFEAVFAGESKQIVAYIQESDADVWVMQKGVSNMHMATSFVSDWKEDKIEEVEGVSEVTPILYLNTVMRAGDRRWFSFIVGLEENDERAGPWAVSDGKSIPGPGEAIVPSVLAKLTGIKMGDKIDIAGHQFTLAGLSEGTFSMANSVTFITLSDLADIMSTIGSMSYFLVDAAPGIDGPELAARILNEVEKVNALPMSSFVENDWDVAMQMGLEIIGLMTVIGAALAVLLTGFIVYSYTVRKERELAVMKALGVRDRAIYGSLMVQAAFIAFMGFLLAVAFVLLAAPLTAAFLPQVTLHITLEALFRVGLSALLVALLSAVVPVRKVVRVDPIYAFRD
jgi:putative ABC transport system permease protein